MVSCIYFLSTVVCADDMELNVLRCWADILGTVVAFVSSVPFIHVSQPVHHHNCCPQYVSLRYEDIKPHSHRDSCSGFSLLCAPCGQR